MDANASLATPIIFIPLLAKFGLIITYVAMFVGTWLIHTSYQSMANADLSIIPGPFVTGDRIGSYSVNIHNGSLD